jgi:hypothetical protein
LSGIIASIEQQIAGKMDKVTLATVATSGSYNDLADKPTIPNAVTEITVEGWGFTKNTGTYSKPSTGIPKSDLASAVQTSLGKADTALQSYTEQYKGTVTGVKLNGSTKLPSDGVVDLGTVITSHQDISGKQDNLVSGTNIKTINGESILGSGDITIEGGSADSNWRMTKEYVTSLYPIVVKDNTYTVVTDTAGVIVFSLDANTTNYIQHGVVYVSFGDNALLQIISHQLPTFASPDFLIKPNTTYEIDFLFTGSCWLVSALEFEETNIGAGSGGSGN